MKTIKIMFNCVIFFQFFFLPHFLIHAQVHSEDEELSAVGEEGAKILSQLAENDSGYVREEVAKAASQIAGDLEAQTLDLLAEDKSLYVGLAVVEATMKNLSEEKKLQILTLIRILADSKDSADGAQMLSWILAENADFGEALAIVANLIGGGTKNQILRHQPATSSREHTQRVRLQKKPLNCENVVTKKENRKRWEEERKRWEEEEEWNFW